jgi:hypothetical protein
MRNLVLALIVLGASSCCSVYTVTDLNTCGVVRDFRTVANSPDGDMLYFVEIAPADRFFIHYTTNKRFQIGDTVCFKATGFPLKK